MCPMLETPQEVHCPILHGSPWLAHVTALLLSAQGVPAILYMSQLGLSRMGMARCVQGQACFIGHGSSSHTAQRALLQVLRDFRALLSPFAHSLQGSAMHRVPCTPQSSQHADCAPVLCHSLSKTCQVVFLESVLPCGLPGSFLCVLSCV